MIDPHTDRQSAPQSGMIRNTVAGVALGLFAALALPHALATAIVSLSALLGGAP